MSIFACPDRPVGENWVSRDVELVINEGEME